MLYSRVSVFPDPGCRACMSPAVRVWLDMDGRVVDGWCRLHATAVSSESYVMLVGDWPDPGLKLPPHQIPLYVERCSNAKVTLTFFEASLRWEMKLPTGSASLSHGGAFVPHPGPSFVHLSDVEASVVGELATWWPDESASTKETGRVWLVERSRQFALKHGTSCRFCLAPAVVLWVAPGAFTYVPLCVDHKAEFIYVNDSSRFESIQSL